MAQPVVRNIVRSSPPPAGGNLTFAALLAFYTPLATTSVMTVAVWPIISSALARTSHPNVSLAAWPIALSIWWLLGTPLQMLQQVVIAALKSSTSAAKLAGFILVVGATASALLAAISFGPILGSFVIHVVGAPPGLVTPVVAAARAMAPLPLIAALLALLQGKLIVQGRTHLVRRAMAANIAALALVLFSGTVWTATEGTLLAAIGLVVSSSVEVSLLHYYARAPSGRKCSAGVL